VAIVSARRTRHLPTPANDNRAPLGLYLMRLARVLVPLAAAGGLIWYFL